MTQTPKNGTPADCTVEALAALGAELKLHRDGTSGDPKVSARLQEVVRSIDPQLSDQVRSVRADYSTDLIQTAMRQAIDLQGHVSRLIV